RAGLMVYCNCTEIHVNRDVRNVVVGEDTEGENNQDNDKTGNVDNAGNPYNLDYDSAQTVVPVNSALDVCCNKVVGHSHPPLNSPLAMNYGFLHHDAHLMVFAGLSHNGHFV